MKKTLILESGISNHRNKTVQKRIIKAASVSTHGGVSTKKHYLSRTSSEQMPNPSLDHLTKEPSSGRKRGQALKDQLHTSGATKPVWLAAVYDHLFPHLSILPSDSRAAIRLALAAIGRFLDRYSPLQTAPGTGFSAPMSRYPRTHQCGAAWLRAVARELDSETELLSSTGANFSSGKPTTKRPA